MSRAIISFSGGLRPRPSTPLGVARAVLEGRGVTRAVLAITLCLAPLSGLTGTAAPDLQEQPRPRIELRVTPPMGVAPLRIVATAELVGGADDYFDFYCARVSWDWADGTRSESIYDCAPHEPGKSEILRRFAQQHTFRDPGRYEIRFELKQGTKVVGSSSLRIDVHGG